MSYEKNKRGFFLYTKRASPVAAQREMHTSKKSTSSWQSDDSSNQNRRKK